MKTSQSVQNNLDYLKQALSRDDGAFFPPSIAVLWAVICGVGFTIMDFRPEIAGIYWISASIPGFLLSAWLGYRARRSAGALNRRAGSRWMLHFGTLLAAMLVAGASGIFSGFQLGVVALLLCGVVYLLAGVHMARPLLWVGVLLLAGVPMVVLVRQWQWTLVGGLIAAALLAVAVWGKSSAQDDSQ